MEAINGRQTTLVVTLALALGGTFLLVNLLLDVLYRLIDPRLREGSWTS
jgi:ABC-type dipeptide/oligopeptide/nickel transport system permease component